MEGRKARNKHNRKGEKKSMGVQKNYMDLWAHFFYVRDHDEKSNITKICIKFRC